MLRIMLPLALCALALGSASPAHAQAKRGANTPQSDRAFLGLSCDERNDEVLVTGVYDGTAADTLGLREGDVIDRFNKAAVSGIDQLIEQIQTVAPGTKFKIKVRRGNESLVLGGRMGSRAKFEARQAREAAEAERGEAQRQRDRARRERESSKKKAVQSRKNATKKNATKRRAQPESRAGNTEFNERANALQTRWETSMLDLQEALDRGDEKRARKLEKGIQKLERAMSQLQESYAKRQGLERAAATREGKQAQGDRLAEAEREMKQWLEGETRRIKNEAKEEIAGLHRMARERMQALRAELEARERREREARSTRERKAVQAKRGRDSRSDRGGDGAIDRRLDRLESQMGEIRELLGELLKRGGR